jgi:hypothetical protein
LPAATTKSVLGALAIAVAIRFESSALPPRLAFTTLTPRCDA